MNHAATMNEDRDRQSEPSEKFPIWALAPILLLGFSMTLIGIMVSISTNDPGFAVEADYYQKAVNWDAHRAQQTANARLGWQTSWRFEPLQGTPRQTRLSLTLNDASMQPLQNAHVEVLAFANARASRVETLALRETSPGVYEGPFDLHRGGLWEFRLTARHQGQTFTGKLEPEFPSSGLRAPLNME
jgi:hypothetical protein